MMGRLDHSAYFGFGVLNRPTPETFAGLSIDDLVTVHAGLRAAVDGAIAIHNQDRAGDAGEAVYDLLDQLISAIEHWESAVAREIVGRSPENRHDRDRWLAFVLKQHAEAGDWSEVAKAVDRLPAELRPECFGDVAHIGEAAA